MVRIIGNYHWFDGAYFDHLKYRDTHMALTAQLLQPLGLRRLESDKSLIVEAAKPGDVVASSVAYFDSVYAAHAAIASAGKELMMHVATYSNIRPKLHIAEISSHFSTGP